MKRFVIVLTIMLMVSGAMAQAPDTVWSQTYGDKPGWSGYDQLEGATPTYDGGFAMNGTSTSWDDTIKGDQWVVKINADGDTLWTATFGDFDRRDYASDIIETYDHGLAILGHGRIANTTEDYRVRFFKADSLGNELWDHDFVGVNDLNTESVIECSDHGFAIVGHTEDYNTFLIRTDSLGDSLWSKVWGGVDRDNGYGIIQTSDNGFMIASGTESFAATVFDVWVIRTDASGDTLWTRTIDGGNYEEGYGITATHDGNYMIGGIAVGTNNDVFLVKITDTGDTLWTKNVGQTDANDLAWSITPTSDNGFLLAGTHYNISHNHNDMYLLKIDADGDTLWSYTHANSIHDEGIVAWETADGGVCLFGTRAVSSSGEYRDYWAVAMEFPVSVNEPTPNGIPSEFVLANNYPNPFNPTTTIEYAIPVQSHVRLDIFNVLGQRVQTLVDRPQTAGQYIAHWNGMIESGTPSPTGVYFYRLQAGDYVKSMKMLLVK